MFWIIPKVQRSPLHFWHRVATCSWVPENVDKRIQRGHRDIWHDEMMENTRMLVELTADELGIINNALNEVCNGIDLEGEFDTRIGCTVEEARAVLAKIHALASTR